MFKYIAIFFTQEIMSPYQGRIGGDAPLTPEGRVYAGKLAAFMEKMHPPSSSRRGESIPAVS